MEEDNIPKYPDSKSCRFTFQQYKWLYLNSPDMGVYRLYHQKESIVQIYPTDGEIQNGYSLSRKDYESQVWFTKDELTLPTSLSIGEIHADSYIKQIEREGPPKRLPPYLLKHQHKDHIWTMDSRSAAPDGYIENERGNMIVKFHILERENGEETYQLSWKEPESHKWSEKSIDSLTMGPIFDIGEQKADQYLGIRRSEDLTLEFPGLPSPSDNFGPEEKVPKGVDKEME